MRGLRTRILPMVLLATVPLGCDDGDGRNASFEELGATEAKALIDSSPDIVVIDVSPYWAEGHIPGAVNHPVGDGSLAQAIPTLDKSKPYLVYCHGDGPAIEGAQLLVDAGFARVYRLKGNFQAWKDAGYAVETAPAASFTEVDAARAKELIDSTPGLVVIDVSPFWAEGHIPGAVNHPLGDGSLAKAIPTLDKSKAYLVYCHGDGPAIEGAQALVDAGFSPVYRLKGNFQAWKDAGYAVEKAPAGSFTEVDATQAKALIDTTPALVIIDVSPYWAEGHIPGAVNHPVGDGSLEKALPTLDMQQPYLVYCHGDAPSIQGAQLLVDAGFGPVYRLKGNFQAWKDAGYAVETAP